MFLFRDYIPLDIKDGASSRDPGCPNGPVKYLERKWHCEFSDSTFEMWQMINETFKAAIRRRFFTLH
jgi:hypothetical protein